MSDPSAEQSTGKSAAELEALVMAEIRGNPACQNVSYVIVSQTDNDGGWHVVAEGRDGAFVSGDCKRAVMTAQSTLRRRYHLSFPDA